MTGISLVAVPISIVWLVNGLWLGRKQNALEIGAASSRAVGNSITSTDAVNSR